MSEHGCSLHEVFSIGCMNYSTLFRFDSGTAWNLCPGACSLQEGDANKPACLPCTCHQLHHTPVLPGKRCLPPIPQNDPCHNSLIPCVHGSCSLLGLKDSLYVAGSSSAATSCAAAERPEASKSLSSVTMQGSMAI